MAGVTGVGGVFFKSSEEPTGANKELVRAFFARFGEGDLQGALGFLSDDATWWILGNPEAIPTSGELGKEKLARLLHRMQSQMKGPMQMTVQSLIAEGDRVAAEVVGHAELQNGRVYANRYHFAITMRDGKIAQVREYLDTQHVVATWFTP
jgi:ketosteroid isomerase-like protein